MINELLTSIELCSDYCSEFPFAPNDSYPEYPFSDYSQSPNPVYCSIRNHFKNLQLDIDNFGTPKWNPLGEFDLVNKRIVIKPNWVKHYHPFNENIWSVITHPSLIRVILDYIYIATKGDCEITIGDSPVQSAEFDKLLEVCKMKELQSYFNSKGLHFKIEDFRLERAICEQKGGIIKTMTLSQDPEKYCVVSLADKSSHSEIDWSHNRYRVTGYNKREVLKHHRPGHHEYLISNAVIKSDFLINIPKLKTHRKAGVSLSLKNLVGINCSKDWLPHHRQGTKSTSSDEYEKFYLFQWLGVFCIEWGQMYKNILLRRSLILVGRMFWQIHKLIRRMLHQQYYSEGSWYGNDTIWRTCLDINTILFYSDQNGNVTDNRSQRKYLTILDGTIGGEKESPLEPTPIAAGFSVSAFNPAVSDFTAARAMGLNPDKIPIIKNSFLKRPLPIFDKKPEEIIVKSSQKKLNTKASCVNTIRSFEPSLGWKGHIELIEDPSDK